MLKMSSFNHTTPASIMNFDERVSTQNLRGDISAHAKFA